MFLKTPENVIYYHVCIHICKSKKLHERQTHEFLMVVISTWEKQWIGHKEVTDHIWSRLCILKTIAFLTLAKSKDYCHIIFNTSAHP